MVTSLFPFSYMLQSHCCIMSEMSCPNVDIVLYSLKYTQIVKNSPLTLIFHDNICRMLRKNPLASYQVGRLCMRSTYLSWFGFLWLGSGLVDGPVSPTLLDRLIRLDYLPSVISVNLQCHHHNIIELTRNRSD